MRLFFLPPSPFISPEILVTEELAEKIAVTPVVDLFTADVRSGKTIQIGTNEEFIRELKAKFVKADHGP